MSDELFSTLLALLTLLWGLTMVTENMSEPNYMTISGGKGIGQVFHKPAKGMIVQSMVGNLGALARKKFELGIQ